MKSILFNINWRDVFKSFVASIISSIASTLIAYTKNKIEQHDYNFTSSDLNLILGMALITFLGSIGQRLVTDEEGKVLGKL